MGGGFIENYDERGVYQLEKAGRQLVRFDGMQYEGETGRRTVTPTDIDGYIEVGGEAFVLFELKHHGKMPVGQRKALTRLADAIEESGRDVVVFLAEHQTPEGEDVVAKDAEVTGIYLGSRYNGRWVCREHPRKLGDEIENFLKWVREGKHERQRPG